jgi:site-specific DNA recombinase
MRPRTKHSKKKSPVRATRVVAYIRVSTARQALEGHSLEAQQTQLEAYALAHGLTIVAFEVDAGESASSLERPALKRALGMLDARQAEGIVVVKLDRLTRSVRDFTYLVDTYFKDGAFALMSIHESVDTSTPLGRMVLTILMSVCQWEREAAAERTATVMKHLKDAGKFTGGRPPYGWAVDEEGVLVAALEEQVIVQRARELRAGGHALRKIAGALGINPRTGNEFNVEQVVRMIDSADALGAV